MDDLFGMEEAGGAWTGDDRAGVFYNRYLDFHKDAKVFDELVQFYEETGKDGLAQIVRKRRDNPVGR